jgi:hypothetical protein
MSAARISATPRTEPMTMPAMAPADRPGSGDGGTGGALVVVDDLETMSGVELGFVAEEMGVEDADRGVDDEAGVELGIEEVALAANEAARTQTPGVKP